MWRFGEGIGLQGSDCIVKECMGLDSMRGAGGKFLKLCTCLIRNSDHVYVELRSIHTRVCNSEKVNCFNRKYCTHLTIGNLISVE